VLDESERAYRRGALQAIQFLKELISPVWTGPVASQVLNRFEQELIKGRTSEEVAYLGTYLDTVVQKVAERVAETLLNLEVSPSIRRTSRTPHAKDTEPLLEAEPKPPSFDYGGSIHNYD
jgi:hypothetical protein